jgi:hypothetical protein
VPIFAATVAHGSRRDVKLVDTRRYKTSVEGNAESSRTARSSQGGHKFVPLLHQGWDSPRRPHKAGHVLVRTAFCAPDTGMPVLADGTCLAHWPDNADSLADGASGGQLPDKPCCSSGSGRAAAESSVRSL